MSSIDHPLTVPNSEHEISSLADLLKIDCQLTREEVLNALDRVPLYVLADDEPEILRTLVRILSQKRERLDSLVQVEGDMLEHLDALGTMREGHTPMILCRNGKQAEDATKVICERQIEDSVLIFDHDMGIPRGLDIFKKYHPHLPVSTVRAFHSGTLPSDTDDCKETNIIDLILKKPVSDPSLMQWQIAQAYLAKRVNGKSTK